MPRGFGGVKPPRRPTFEAKYDSQCEACGEDIRRGDQAMFDEYDEVVHTECPPLAPYLALGAAKCPKCNLVHSGECW